MRPFRRSPLDRPTADANARVTATAYTFNSRPVQHLWLNARFRSYDFDNRTPVFQVPTTVVVRHERGDVRRRGHEPL